MAPNAGDIAKLRAGRHTTEVVINAVPKVVVATARINQTSFTYPISEIVTDNEVGWADAKFGQMVLIGTAPGASDVMTGIVRKPTIAGKLYIDAKNLGDAGYTMSIVTPLAEDQYITIIKYRPPWGLLSSIRKGIFYKAWDRVYSGENRSPEPIPVLGPWRQAFVDDSGMATVAFDCSESYYWNKTAGSILWNLDGGSVFSGSLSANAVTGEFAPGFYEITCRLTDSAGKIHTGYRYLWVNSTDRTSEFAPFNYRFLTTITSDRQEVAGRSMTMDVSGRFDNEELFSGQAFIVTERPKFNGEYLEDESNFVTTFVGYRPDRSVTATAFDSTTTINLEGPLVIGKSIVTATQQIVEVQSPANWTQCTQVLSNPVGAAWYAMVYHAPYLVDGHDFRFDARLPLLRKRSFQFVATEIATQLQSVAETFLGIIGCQSDGTVAMVLNPMYFTNDDRNLMETWWTWLPGDISETITKPYSFRVTSGQVFGGAFSYDGKEPTPYNSLAPGYSRAQSSVTSQMPAFIVTKAKGQTEVNRLVGHQLAYDNKRAQEFGFVADGNIDIIEPTGINRWNVLQLAASYDPQSEAVNDRMIPVRVTRTWSQDGETTKSIQIDWMPESFGQPGITVPVNRGGANTPETDGWTPGGLDVYQPTTPDLNITVPIMLGWNEQGIHARSFTFAAPKVFWRRTNGLITWLTRDMTLDYTSPYFTSSGRLGVWAVADNGSNELYIYYAENILAQTVIWTLEQTFALNTADGYVGKARIISSKEEPNFTLMAWKDRTGVRYSRSTLSSHTWSAAARVGASVTDTEHDDFDIGVSVFDETQCIIAPDGSVNGDDGKLDWFLYAATSKAGSFAKVGNVPTDERAIIGGCDLISDELCIIGAEVPGAPTPPTPLSIVTFDGLNYTDYTIEGVGTAALGPTPPAAYGQTNSPGLGILEVGATVNFNADYLFDVVTFDAGIDIGPTLTGGTTRTRIRMYNDADELLADKVFEQDYTLGFKSEINAEEMEITEPISKLKVNVGRYFTSYTGTPPFEIFLDNILIEAVLVTRDYDRKLRRVNIDTESWTDITPHYISVPFDTYGISHAVSNPAEISLIASNEQGFTYLFHSTNSGASWHRIRKTNYVGTKRTSGIVIPFGFGGMGISNDLGETIYSRIGDWAAAVSAVGIINGVTGVL